MQNINSVPSPAKSPKLSKAAAESIAIEVLGFLAGDPARLDRFFAVSGLEADNLRAAATEPEFLAAVLDHLVSDESLLLASRPKPDTIRQCLRKRTKYCRET
jgi:hypothetical protein